MNGVKRGFLLLTSHLGDMQSKPLTVAQLRQLAKVAGNVQRLDADRALNRTDLLQLGYSQEMSGNILQLLSREQQLEYYLKQAAAAGAYPLTRGEEDFPAIIRRRMGLDCPGCLWYKGDKDFLRLPMVSLVGSRDLYPENLQFALEVGTQAARQGYALVSGNARGADQAAQKACLAAGGIVISIVSDSLDAHKAQKNILYVSEDGFDLTFTPGRALSRNRLIHCMGQVTLVAQCTYGRGGTWKGSLENLRRRYSPIFCFQDGSQGIMALCDRGAVPIGVQELWDFSVLRDTELHFPI